MVDKISLQGITFFTRCHALYGQRQCADGLDPASAKAAGKATHCPPQRPSTIGGHSSGVPPRAEIRR